MICKVPSCFMFCGSADEYEQTVMQAENKRAVWLTAARYLKDRNHIEDIVQETFIFAYFYYGKLEDESKLKAWLCGIARNKSLKFIRGSSHEPVPFEDMPDLSTPESIYIEREDKARLQEIISELPEESAQTVRMYYFEGKSIEQVAHLLAIKPGTVKSRLHNARNKLKLRLEGEYAMSENINSIIKESIKIAKEKIALQIAEIERKEDYSWGDFWNLTFAAEQNVKEHSPGLTPSEQDEVILEGYEKSIEALLKKNDFEGLANVYDAYSDFYFYRDIGDLGLSKMQQAAEYADKAKIFELSARLKGHAEIIEKRLELRSRGKDIVQRKWRNGAIALKKYDKTIVPSWHFGNCFGDNTDYNIFGSLLPLYDLDWLPDRNGWQVLREYSDAGFKALDEDYNPNGVIYKILYSKHGETVKIGAQVYEGCLKAVYRREVDGGAGEDGHLLRDRYFQRYATDVVWYAPNVGIVKVNRTTPMEEQITYWLDDYKVNGEGMGNQYMPLADGNYWSYKAAGDNVADMQIYGYINKFSVTHADGDSAAVSHMGWIHER